jgi:hypothetical protein
MSPQPNSPEIDRLFNGKKAKWLPLYRRLIARLTRVPGLDITPGADAIALRQAARAKPVGAIRVAGDGLEIGLALAKAAIKTPRLRPSTRSPKYITHRVLITDVREIDDELFTWILAANQRARSARGRSASRGSRSAAARST